MSLLTSGAGGEDSLQVKIAVFSLVLSLVVTMLVPLIAPAYNSETGYTWEEIYFEKSNLEAFTGESMTNMTPWKLSGVYTPWSVDKPVNIDPETGWIYGEDVSSNYAVAGFNGITHVGDTSNIYLDKNQKSSTLLSQTKTNILIEQTSPVWWASTLTGKLNLVGSLVSLFGTPLGISVIETKQVPTDVNSWSFTGYRYEFDPMLRIDYDSQDKDPDYSKASQVDAKLSLVWFKDPYNQGLSTGLILYNNSNNGLLAYISMDDIIENYNQANNYSSRYELDYNGVKVYVNVRFDQNVLLNGSDLKEAFDNGNWSLAITASSMDNFIDIANSNTLSSSMGNLLDTYLDIFTLSMPAVPLTWSMVLWLVCILPLEVSMIMFLSRFGLVGIGAAILGNVFLTML